MSGKNRDLINAIVATPGGGSTIKQMDNEDFLDLWRFDAVFKSKGGYYDTHQLPEPAKQFLDNIIKGTNGQISAIRKNRVHYPIPIVHLIASSKLGASAGKSEGKYFIGINVATSFILNDLFCRMLSSCKILRQFGDPSKEGETQKINFAATTEIKELAIEKNPNENIIPRDSTRAILAQVLTSWATKFLSMHEYAHIVFGHVDYKENLLREGKSLSPMNSQTLEYDADCYAAQIAFREIIFAFENSTDVKDELRPFYADLEIIIFVWAYAIYSMYRLFQVSGVDEYTLHLNKYPHVGIRQRLMMTMMCTLVDREAKRDTRYSGTLDRVSGILKSVIEQAEKAFDEISNQGFCDGNIRFAFFSPKADSHFKAIHNHFDNVRSELEKFSYGTFSPFTPLR
ncbi:hypothetical protein [Chryseolinea lacunae]|uniref:Peptidase M48 domain-containing protein n=1 Tax=Chryseolinea lacunae TaxID=2801331 RepID=A0ABS1L1A5_9BACT|nr:hypothetical protein [Chryseolinea lacunae]MBL0745488.1 hypothetical protein [Chryseolinea lacunae]